MSDEFKQDAHTHPILRALLDGESKVYWAKGAVIVVTNGCIFGMTPDGADGLARHLIRCAKTARDGAS